MGDGRAGTPPTFVSSVQRDLARAAVELLQDVRARAQRERERRADVGGPQRDRLLDEELAGRRRRRRLADDRLEDPHGSTGPVDGHRPARGVDDDVPAGDEIGPSRACVIQPVCPFGRPGSRTFSHLPRSRASTGSTVRSSGDRRRRRHESERRGSDGGPRTRLVRPEQGDELLGRAHGRAAAAHPPPPRNRRGAMRRARAGGAGARSSRVMPSLNR